jgi:poly-gamma-glutamate synthesis protein (capsule biosynthesis protein)
MAVGDIMLGEHPPCLGHGVDTIIRQKGECFPFESVSSTLCKADVTFGNLEAVLSDKGRSKTVFSTNVLRGRPSSVKGLINSGFNILSLANNHAMQHGDEALLDTIRLLSNNDIKCIGINEKKCCEEPVIFEKEGLKVGFLAYCQTQQYNFDCQRTVLIELPVMKSDIEKLKNLVDIVVISLHWGDEYIDRPSPDQIKLGHKLIDLGANVILGHHPHVLQGIERYNSGIIAYSLGSFVFDLWQQNIRESIILDLKIYPENIEIDFIPIFINECWQPVILAGEKGNNILSRFDGLSKALKNKEVSDIDTENNCYKRDVAKLLRNDNIEKLWHYLKYLPNYDRKLLVQNIFTIIKRRVIRRMI